MRRLSILIALCLLLVAGCGATEGTPDEALCAEVATFTTELLTLQREIQSNYEKATACLDEWSNLEDWIEAEFTEYVGPEMVEEYYSLLRFAEEDPSFAEKIGEARVYEMEEAGAALTFIAATLETWPIKRANGIYGDFNRLQRDVIALDCPTLASSLKQQFIEANKAYFDGLNILCSLSWFNDNFARQRSQVKDLLELFIAYRSMAVNEWNTLLPEYGIEEISAVSFESSCSLSPDDPRYGELQQQYKRLKAELEAEYQQEQTELDEAMQEWTDNRPAWVSRGEWKKYRDLEARDWELGIWYEESQKDIDQWFEDSKQEIASDSSAS